MILFTREYKVFCLSAVTLVLVACASGGSSTAPATSKENVQSKTGSTSVSEAGSGVLVLPSEIQFAEGVAVRDAVRQECLLQGKLAIFIKQFSSSNYSNIITDADSIPANAEVLKIEIDGLTGPKGGAWSGGKMVSIHGSLMRNGTEIGDFKARRVSGGGFFGGYKGTCAILGRCVKTLGKDVANWLQNPTKNAVLGDY